MKFPPDPILTPIPLAEAYTKVFVGAFYNNLWVGDIEDEEVRKNIREKEGYVASDDQVKGLSKYCSRLKKEGLDDPFKLCDVLSGIAAINESAHKIAECAAREVNTDNDPKSLSGVELEAANKKTRGLWQQILNKAKQQSGPLNPVKLGEALKEALRGIERNGCSALSEKFKVPPPD